MADQEKRAEANAEVSLCQPTIWAPCRTARSRVHRLNPFGKRGQRQQYKQESPRRLNRISLPNRFCRSDKAQMHASERRSRSGGDAGGFRGRTRSPSRRQTLNASSRSRSGGDEEIHTRAGSINFAIAHFVVTTGVTLEDLETLLFQTPDQIVVVTYDVWMEVHSHIPDKVATAVANLKREEQV